VNSFFGGNNGGPITNPNALIGYIQKATDLVFFGGGIAALGIAMWGAFLLATSEGDPQKLSKGRTVLSQGVIGAIIMVLAGVAIKWVITALGG
jgi:hypothetical protein